MVHNIFGPDAVHGQDSQQRDDWKVVSAITKHGHPITKDQAFISENVWALDMLVGDGYTCSRMAVEDL